MVEAHSGEKPPSVLSAHSFESIQRAIELSLRLPGIAFALQRRDSQDLRGRRVAQEVLEARQSALSLSEAELSVPEGKRTGCCWQSSGVLGSKRGEGGHQCLILLRLAGERLLLVTRNRLAHWPVKSLEGSPETACSLL